LFEREKVPAATFAWEEGRGDDDTEDDELDEA
jgi:hypothetical protein